MKTTTPDLDKLVETMKAKAKADPFILSSDGRQAIRTPKQFNMDLIVVDGVQLSVNFTYDIFPSRTAEHLSMRGIAGPVPQEIQAAVKKLFFGDQEAEAHTPPKLFPTSSHHWIVWLNSPDGFTAEAGAAPSPNRN